MNKRNTSSPLATSRIIPVVLFVYALAQSAPTPLSAQNKRQPSKTASSPAGAASASPTSPASLRASIRVLARSYGDSIIVRWAPTNNWAWSSLNHTGYLIERIDLSEARHPKRELLTPKPIKPLTLDQMKTVFDRNDKYAAIAAQCLYGRNFSVGIRKGQGGLEDKANVWKDRYAFAMDVADFDGQVAKAEAMRFTDTKVQKNGIYIYRVFAAQPPLNGHIDSGNAMVENTGRIPPGRPKVSEAVATDRQAELHWPRVQQEPYSGYSIERSADGRNFKPLNTLPYISSKPDSTIGRSTGGKNDTLMAKIAVLLKTQQVYIDSLPQNYHRYYYRIKGINAFAEWSNYSDTLSVMGIDLTAPAAPIVENPKYTGGRKLLLRWKKPFKEGDFKGYLVTRSHNAVAGPYSPITSQILPSTTTQFEDDSAFAHGQNFYIVLALDTAGNTAYSIPAMGLIPDNTPPAVPKGLKGFITKNGQVHLSWNPNPDEDMKGYKVYFANSSDHIFTQITLKPTADTVFTDSITLRTLSKYIWYKIAAVDQNNNHSAYSMAVRLRKPDLVAPTAPLATNVRVDTGGVQIDFIQSSSEDVVNYIIYRKEGGGPWTPLYRQPHDKARIKFHFTDKGLKPFTNYSYCAEAVDEDSLHSGRSTAIRATVKTIPDLPPVTGLAASYDEKARQIRLSWQYQNTGDYFFVLYRAAGNGALTKFRSLAAQTADYHDDDLPAKGGQNLGYAIQVFFKDKRGRTRLSEPVSVAIPSK
jgi:fibronectin type 3 domain-containing protein